MREYDDILEISRAMIRTRENGDAEFHRLLEIIGKALEQATTETGLPYSCCMALASDYMKFSLEESLKEVERIYVQRKDN